MKKELETLKPRVFKVVLVTIIMLLGMVLWANAQDFQPYQDGIHTVTYDITVPKDNKLEVILYIDEEYGNSDRAMLMLGMKKRIHRGQTFGYSLNGEEYGYTKEWDKRSKARISKRTPFGFMIDHADAREIIEKGISHVIIADEWYELPSDEQAKLLHWAKKYVGVYL